MFLLNYIHISAQLSKSSKLRALLEAATKVGTAVVFLCDAVMPLITRHCLNLIRKKDKAINNECFVVIPVINIA